MNAAEQRRQHTVAQRLEQTSESVAVLLDALDARLFDQATKAQETRREVNSLRADLDAQSMRLLKLGERLELLNAFHHNLVLDLGDRLPKPNTFWGRLSWLFTGR